MEISILWGPLDDPHLELILPSWALDVLLTPCLYHSHTAL